MRTIATSLLALYLGFYSILTGYNLAGFILQVPAEHHHRLSLAHHVKTRTHIYAMAGAYWSSKAPGISRDVTMTTETISHHWHHMRVLATAYLIVDNQDDPGHHCPVYNGRTANGEHVHTGGVAVDTGILPFGTHLDVPGYGLAKANDTGGWINGHHIDLPMTSCLAAHRWGAPHVMVAYETPNGD